ncbi:MAG: hypothetical protein ABTQ34_02295 [Bdellovibrionales bacterium]
MSAAQAKRISLKYKRAGKFLCATALAASAALSAFAPRDANAVNFILKYEGKPFVPGTKLNNDYYQTCGLNGNIKLEITFSADDTIYANTTPRHWLIINDDELFGAADSPKPTKFHAEVNGVVYDLSYSDIPKCSADNKYGCPLGTVGNIWSDDKGSVYDWDIATPYYGLPTMSNINHYTDPRFGTEYHYNTTPRNYDYFGADNSNNADKLGCNYNTPGTWTITRDGDTPDPTDPTDPIPQTQRIPLTPPIQRTQQIPPRLPIPRKTPILLPTARRSLAR